MTNPNFDFDDYYNRRRQEEENKKNSPKPEKKKDEEKEKDKDKDKDEKKVSSGRSLGSMILSRIVAMLIMSLVTLIILACLGVFTKVKNGQETVKNGVTYYEQMLDEVNAQNNKKGYGPNGDMTYDEYVDWLAWGGNIGK